MVRQAHHERNPGSTTNGLLAHERSGLSVRDERTLGPLRMDFRLTTSGLWAYGRADSRLKTSGLLPCNERAFGTPTSGLLAHYERTFGSRRADTRLTTNGLSAHH